MKRESYARIMGWIVTLAVIATLVVAFMIVGSPVEARKAAGDQTRINALRSLETQIQSYYASNKKLPKSLTDLPKPTYGGNSDGLDPITKKPFEYKVVDKDHFSLCAVFETDTGKEKTGYWDEFGGHPKGRFCFDLPAKP